MTIYTDDTVDPIQKYVDVAEHWEYKLSVLTNT